MRRYKSMRNVRVQLFGLAMRIAKHAASGIFASAMTLDQSMWSASIRMLCAMRALRWVLASVTVVMMVTMTTAAYGSHGTRQVSDVAVDPMDVLYALTWDPGVPNREVWRSTDGGATWTSTAMAHPSFIGLAIAPTTPDPTLYVYSDCTGDSSCAGLRKSTDGGATWASAGFPNANVFAVTVAPDVPTTLYAHADNAGTVGWFKSIDAGTSWTVTSWPVWQLVIDQANPTTLYGLNGYDILRSLDGGTSWSVVLTLPQPPFTEDGRYDITAIAPFVAVAGSTVYAVNSAYLVPYCDPDLLGYCEWYPDPATVSYSNDGGSTWNLGVLGYYQVWDLAMHGSTLHAATTTPYWSFESPGAIKSTDGGAHWVNTNLNIDSRRLGVDSNAVYAVTSQGLFKRAHDGATWTATALAPHPPEVASLSLAPSTVTSGTTSTGTVTLSAAAPAGGAVVTLSSANTAVVTVPSGVTVPAGTTTATFAVATSAVTSSTTVTVSGTSGGATRSAQLTVTPAPTLTSLSLQPTVPGGSTSTGTVTLSAAAPAGGAVVTLSSSSTAVATVPTSVTVPAGTTTVGLVVSTNAVSSATVVTISATLAGVSRSAALTVTPITALVSISLSPTDVRGGTPSTATIVLSGAAPPGGLTVKLSSNHPSIAAVPSSITVAAGATSAQVTVSTSRPKSTTEVTISANLATVTKAATLTVRR